MHDYLLRLKGILLQAVDLIDDVLNEGKPPTEEEILAAQRFMEQRDKFLETIIKRLEDK